MSAAGCVGEVGGCLHFGILSVALVVGVEVAVIMRADFENDRPAKKQRVVGLVFRKIALEQLYLEGSLMTLRIFKNFYGLSEDVVPSGIDKSMFYFSSHPIVSPINPAHW